MSVKYRHFHDSALATLVLTAILGLAEVSQGADKKPITDKGVHAKRAIAQTRELTPAEQELVKRAQSEFQRMKNYPPAGARMHDKVQSQFGYREDEEAVRNLLPHLSDKQLRELRIQLEGKAK